MLKLILPHLRRATKELHVHFQPGDMNVQHAWFTILGSVYDPSEGRHKMISFVVSGIASGGADHQALIALPNHGAVHGRSSILSEMRLIWWTL